MAIVDTFPRETWDFMTFYLRGDISSKCSLKGVKRENLSSRCVHDDDDDDV